MKGILHTGSCEATFIVCKLLVVIEQRRWRKVKTVELIWAWFLFIKEKHNFCSSNGVEANGKIKMLPETNC